LLQDLIEHKNTLIIGCVFVSIVFCSPWDQWTTPHHPSLTWTVRWGFPLPTHSPPLDFRVRAFPTHTTLPHSKYETEGPPNTKGHQHGVFSCSLFDHWHTPNMKRHQQSCWCLFLFGISPTFTYVHRAWKGTNAGAFLCLAHFPKSLMSGEWGLPSPSSPYCPTTGFIKYLLLLILYMDIIYKLNK